MIRSEEKRLESSQEEITTCQTECNVKANDAEILEFLWDQILVPDENPEKLKALGHLREFTLRWCKQKIQREFIDWFFKKHPQCSRAIRYPCKGHDEWNREL
jgi:hypothetical protein